MKMMRIILLCEFCYFVFSPLLHADGVQLNLHIKSLSFESYERQKVTFELGEKGKFIKILARWEDGKTVAVPVETMGNIDDVDLQSLKVSSLFKPGRDMEIRGDLVILVEYGNEIYIEPKKDGLEQAGLERLVLKRVARIEINDFKYVSLQIAVPDNSGKRWKCTRKPFGGKEVNSGVFESSGNPWAGLPGKWLTQGD